eukprot:CAMPEP_0196826426 /NCGR_PEP_ID=MMETSP1362-20130617/93619_1 /TAXON_ID=163516 /ORGANISM="Leptocylindrus danicus, Strain CCMP1856" /LENGTH=199 /DNA_ID=CAMNT_0042206995 /DNA_START=282 /DNA_END=881 /DNA_ORIENTATION=-
MHCLLDDDVYVAVGRRFDKRNMDERVMERIKNSNECMLVYPACDAVSVEEGLAELRRRQRVKAWPQDNDESSNKTKLEGGSYNRVNLIFIDATWKHAKEIVDVNTSRNLWPEDTVKVKLDASFIREQYPAFNFLPNRFDIRTPPTPDHLSTAECIAMVLSIVEENVVIYDTIVRALDYMVDQWNSFFNKNNAEQKACEF